MSVIRIEVIVEPRNGGGTLTSVVEIDSSEAEGLSPEERHALLQSVAEDEANQLAPWGWSELSGDGDG